MKQERNLIIFEGVTTSIDVLLSEVSELIKNREFGEAKKIIKRVPVLLNEADLVNSELVQIGFDFEEVEQREI